MPALEPRCQPADILLVHELSGLEKVSEKGGVSVYGLGRFPVTLYYEQWVRVLEHADEQKAFPQGNKGKLKLRVNA